MKGIGLKKAGGGADIPTSALSFFWYIININVEKIF